MNQDAAKLIADRGHNLSKAQKAVLGAVARREVRRDEFATQRTSWVVGGNACTATVQALHKRGLVERGDRLPNERYSIWRLSSPDGYALAERMGLIEKPDATAGSPGDIYDPQEVGQ